ncbi:MAG: class I SAM-dependent methyltransferase [Planctomycetota bacterium]
MPTRTRKQTAKKKKTGARKSRSGPTQASTADRYVLYQRSVQAPESEIDFFLKVFRKHYNRKPTTLREDFCAAAYLCCEWVKAHKDNVAVGLDIDPEPIKWGLEHNADGLNQDQFSRLHLHELNVLDPAAAKQKAEVVYAGNFSYCCFKTRKQLLEYFTAARKGVAKDGIFVCDIFGGPDSQRVGEEETEYEGFTYVWDQNQYDPISSEILCHIHFLFEDGSEWRKAFTYDWRLWTIAEIREVLMEAGFASTEVYWEGSNSKGEGNGVFSKKEKVENEDAWVTYIVGLP